MFKIAINILAFEIGMNFLLNVKKDSWILLKDNRIEAKDENKIILILKKLNTKTKESK